MSNKSEAISRDVVVAPVRWSPETDAERRAVRQQVTSILESPPFRTSKRYRALLNHVVEKALRGDAGALKERTLGIEVFHREPDYDTNSDPVVRIAAGEVRRRLAQYYYDATHRNELHIELPAGSYIPEFYDPAGEGIANAPNESDHVAGNRSSQRSLAANAPHAIEQNVRAAAGNLFGLWLPIACLMVGLVAGAFAMRVHSTAASSSSALDQFWRPLIDSPGSVWVSVGQVYAERVQLQPNGARNRFDARYAVSLGQNPAPMINLADSAVLASVAGALQSRNKGYSVHGATDTTFSDLAGGPSVLIGGFNNDWSIRLSDQLRFHFEADANTKERWIVDREKPEQKIGLHVLGGTTTDTRDAYAIISRVHDPSTRRMVVALAGVSQNGTRAAGIFVSDPDSLQEFAKEAPVNWQNSNLQIVVTAAMIDGSLGRPRAISSYAW